MGALVCVIVSDFGVSNGLIGLPRMAWERYSCYVAGSVLCAWLHLTVHNMQSVRVGWFDTLQLGAAEEAGCMCRLECHVPP